VVKTPTVSLKLFAPEDVPSLTKTVVEAALNTLLLLKDVLILLVGRAHLVRIQRAVGRLSRERHSAIQQRRHLRESAIGGL
jgi:hypothetical protein